MNVSYPALSNLMCVSCVVILACGFLAVIYFELRLTSFQPLKTFPALEDKKVYVCVCERERERDGRKLCQKNAGQI